MNFRTLCRFVGFAAAASVLSFCSHKTSPLGPSAAPATVSTSAVTATSFSGPPSRMTGTLVGAGDIGDCNTAGAVATARLLDRFSGTVFTAGDNAYGSGTVDEFQRCYEPSWGRHRGRTRPVPGNHEYQSGAGGYFGYFGAIAGQAEKGYYSYAEGPWRIIALNSEIPSGAGSAQMDWLRRELSSTTSACTAVIWHRPLFSSGRNGDNPDMRAVWQALYEFQADLVINAHDHVYERFALQDPDGRPDPARGIRQFTVGTGGAPLSGFSSVRANSEVRAAAWGVAAFTLSETGYQWEFVPVDGESFRDSGSAPCH